MTATPDPGECLMGKSSVRKCPACGYIHGKLIPSPCDDCKSEDWLVSVRDPRNIRTCLDCLRGSK